MKTKHMTFERVYGLWHSDLRGTDRDGFKLHVMSGEWDGTKSYLLQNSSVMQRFSLLTLWLATVMNWWLL